jgi:hypothetical protein
MANPVNESMQPCWECGKPAGGQAPHVYYGNFPFGIAHIKCAERIQYILDRSFRALDELYDKTDTQASKVVVQVLFDTTARKLNNQPLTTLKDDQIRKVLETDGMEAAVTVIRALSKVCDDQWKYMLSRHKDMMQGEVFISYETKRERVREVMELLERSFESRRIENEKFLATANEKHEQLNASLLAFDEEVRNGKNKAPFFIVPQDLFQFYCTHFLDTLEKLTEKYARGKMIFLAIEVQDPGYLYMTHVKIAGLALLPPTVSIADANQFWEKNCTDEWTKSEGARVRILPTECLQWQNHYITIGSSLKRSCGGSKERPLDIYPK